MPVKNKWVALPLVLLLVANGRLTRLCYNVTPPLSLVFPSSSVLELTVASNREQAGPETVKERRQITKGNLNRKVCNARDGSCMTHIPPILPKSQLSIPQQPNWGAHLANLVGTVDSAVEEVGVAKPCASEIEI